MNSSIRVIAIDPGSYNLGLCMAHVSPYTLSPIEIDTYNIKVDELPDIGDEQGFCTTTADKRQFCLYSHLRRVFDEFQPHQLALESAFYNRARPSAFASLMGTIKTINAAYKSYNRFGVISDYAPVLIKSVIKAKSRGGKEAVKNSIIEHEVSRVLKKGLDKYSEHEFDSIAVLLTHCHHLRKFGALSWLNK